MSELFGDLVIAYPKTVTACHKEIARLEKLVSDADRIIEVKDKEIDDLQDKVDDLEEGEEGSDPEDAINRFLDECERTGPLRFDVPQSDSVNRAIVALHDVVGRQP